MDALSRSRSTSDSPTPSTPNSVHPSANNASSSAEKQDKAQSIPCKFYLMGHCKAGSACPFAHSKESTGTLVCMFYMKGNCRYGSACRLPHTQSTSSSSPLSNTSPRQIPKSQLSGLSQLTANGIKRPASNSSLNSTNNNAPGSIQTASSAKPFPPAPIYSPSTAASFAALAFATSPSGAATLGISPIAAASYLSHGSSYHDDPADHLDLNGDYLDNIIDAEDDLDEEMAAILPSSLNDLLTPMEQMQLSSSFGGGGLLSSSFSSNRGLGGALDDMPPLPPPVTAWVGVNGHHEDHNHYPITNSSSLGVPDLLRHDGWTNEYPDEDNMFVMDGTGLPSPHLTPQQQALHNWAFQKQTVQASSAPKPSYSQIARTAPLPAAPSVSSIGTGTNTNGKKKHGATTAAAVAKPTPVSVIVSAATTEEPLCPFAMQGNCRFADKCRYIHGDPCPVCLKFVLHPQKPSTHEEHIAECTVKQSEIDERNGAVQASTEMECVVCMEQVANKRDPRFGLLNCDHCVCLQCIRQWRQNERMDTAKTCPICREVTFFVMPSSVWHPNGPEKDKIVADYKAKLSLIDCKHYNFGEPPPGAPAGSTGSGCPFGSSCFYRHVKRDGTKEEEVKLRVVATGREEVMVVNNIRLSDFLR